MKFRSKIKGLILHQQTDKKKDSRSYWFSVTSEKNDDAYIGN